MLFPPLANVLISIDNRRVGEMRFLILGMLLLTAACSQREEGPAEIPVSEVTASDELGGFSSAIRGVAFWTHPSLAFNSLLLVATESSVASYNIEDGNQIDEIDGVRPTDLTMSYMGAGATAKGVVIFYDTAANAFALYTIDNIDRSFIPMAMEMTAPSAVNGYCLGSQNGGGELSLRVLTGDGVETFDIAFDGARAAATKADTIETTATMIDCVVDPLDGALFTATEDGKIYRYADDSETTAPFSIAGAASIVDLGLSMNGLVEGGDTEACCGQLALLDSDTGQVHLFDRDDGHALGIAAISASFDVEGVASASTMGVGYGNFGSAYRNGVLALATKGEAPVIRIAPWTGVLNAVGQPVGAVANPRELLPQAEDPFSIDLDVVTP